MVTHTNGCERPLKIDLHTHVLPKEWPDLQAKFGYPGWISLKHGDDPKQATMMLDGRVFRKINCNCWDDAARAEDCERTDVDVQVGVRCVARADVKALTQWRLCFLMAQVLSTVPVMFSYWAKPEDALEVARVVNDDIAARVKKHPKRYVGLCSVPLQEPKLAVWRG
jgi:aminocarboxymuconate-semialdehyde decarboxylase